MVSFESGGLEFLKLQFGGLKLICMKMKRIHTKKEEENLQDKRSKRQRVRT